MLAEIAAANAAFSILRSAVTNGKDLANFGKQIGAVVLGEEALKEKTEKESKSIWSKIAGKDTADMESFMALETLRENKKELESMMRLYGRPGLYDDWVRYCAEQRKSKRMAELERQEALDKIMEIVGYVIMFIIFMAGLGGLVYAALFLRGM